MATRPLSQAASAAISRAVSGMFARLKVRMLGRAYGPKVLTFGFRDAPHVEDHLSVPGLFDSGSKSQGVTPDGRLRDAMARHVERYIDAYEKRTHASVAQAVEAVLRDSEHGGSQGSVATALGGELARVYGEVKRDVDRLVTTEGVRARNTGALDAASRVGMMTGAGPADEQVFCFVGPNDAKTCDECRRLFFMPDNVTPRCWKLSEIGHAYHKRGDETPKVAGCHPNCRHTPVPIRRGFGFKNGRLAYISPDYDVLADQRGA